LLDGISTTQGVVLYYNGTDWVALSPGTSGHFLKTQGAGANPVWADAGGGGGGGGATYIVKSADETVTSSTTMQNDDELSFSVDASAVYIVDLVLYVASGASNTPDIKTGWTLPTSATVTITQLMYDVGATGTTAVSIGHRYQNTSPSTAQPAGVLTSATQPISAVVQRVVIRTAGTSGTAQLQWAQNTSDGTGTTVKQDSYLAYLKI
jgi:hypothetical protein